jgi:imidazolonepropionase-like amidohydrolase
VNASQATTIVNARVFDGARLRDWTSVRFAGGIVTDCATGSTAQDGDEVIDAEGATILPGLVDSHVHLVPRRFVAGADLRCDHCAGHVQQARCGGRGQATSRHTVRRG